MSLQACAQNNPGQNLDASQAQEMIDGKEVLVLDVRTPAEFGSGHLPEARNLDYYRSDFKDKLAELDSSKTFLVYCRSGARSAKSVNMLQQMGFKEVYNLSGGILAWQRAGMKTVQ